MPITFFVRQTLRNVYTSFNVCVLQADKRSPHKEINTFFYISLGGKRMKLCEQKVEFCIVFSVQRFCYNFLWPWELGQCIKR